MCQYGDTLGQNFSETKEYTYFMQQIGDVQSGRHH